MSVESYRVAATLGLTAKDGMSEIAALVKSLRQVLAAQKDIQAAQAGITSALQSSTSAARAFADQMERAARAARDMAGAGGASGGGFTGGGSGGGGSQPRMLSGPMPMLALPAPAGPPGTGFILNGVPDGPGNSLVPVGIASGGYTGGYSGYAAYRRAANGGAAPGVPARWYDRSGGRGFTMGANGPQGDEPFFNGDEPPLPLYPRASRTDWYSLGWGAQMVGRAAGGLVDDSFMAAAGTAQLKGALRTQGFTDKQADAAYDAAVKTQRDVSGAYVGQNLELVVQLMKQTQDAQEAIALLPATARAQAVFKGLGRGNGMDDVNALLNSAELRGTILQTGADGKESLNLPAYSRFVKNVETMTAMSGGQIGPQQIYQFLRSGGVAGKMLTDDHGFAEDMPFIQAFGAQQAGTALQGFSQQFSGGKMSQAAVKLMTEMGIVKHPSRVLKAGMGNYMMLPGALSTGDLEESRSHPAAFILERLLPAVDKWLEKNYGKSFTGADAKTRQGFEFGALQTVASRITGGKEMAQAVNLAPYINRDVLAQKALQNKDPYSTAVSGNPLMALESYRAALNALQITLGQDNMAVSIASMKALTLALNALTDVFKADPALGAQMMMVANALKIIAPAIAFLSIAVPAIQAGKVVAAGVGLAGTAGEGAVGGVLGPLALAGAVAYGAKKAFDWTQIKFADGLDKLGLHRVASLEAQAAGMSRADADARYNITVKNYIDGKEVAGHVVQSVVKGANTPETGTGTFDARRSLTQPGNN